MLRNTWKAIAVVVVTTALVMGNDGASNLAIARGRPQAAQSAGLPEVLRRAAIVTRGDRSGQIAGAQIGNTGVYVVYMKTASGCGSGGCRAQIWRTVSGQFIRWGSLPVGHLPIVVLPQTERGMPTLGVTVFDKNKGKLVVQPVKFDGTSYKDAVGQLLPVTSGIPLLQRGMLRAFTLQEDPHR